MEIVLGSVAAVICVFYAYAFLKFAKDRDARETVARRMTVALPVPVSGCAK
jgi:hypothetical protein